MKIEETTKSKNQNDIFITVDKSINSINITKSGNYYLYNYNNEGSKKINISIENNLEVKIFEYYKESEKKCKNEFDITCNIGNNTNVQYNVFNNNIFLETNKKINFNLSNNSILKTYILEIGNNASSDYNINLNEEGSFTDFNLMVYADNDIVQNHSVNINHLKPFTTSYMSNHGVIDHHSSCNFDLKTFIKKGSVKSIANQTSKILTLSETCNTKINPQLLIDEFDVIGGHGASCGRVSDEIMYYMQSRGIDKILVNQLIAIGNLLKNVPKDLMEQLIQELERRIKHE